ncbi:hypothetical protein FJT64_019852 [Amphibalanus amphitrite]|uniref:Peptidase A2 domain-containing protein n=1 Tax=Amphibalanus amphitrite TaxID=1232801 RepID=A0A6A4X286_AMPAM|nr:hypothetical protein FJT64_019852 [Amphibalanus amphitrite]
MRLGSEEFGAWRQKFADFQLLTRLGTLSIDEQKATLTSLLDDEWTRTLRYSLQVPQDANLETVLDIMEAHLRGQRSIILDRRDFYSRIQEPDEMFDDFLSSIKEIAAYCDFCDVCVDDQYRDRVVVGTRDEEALKRMLHEPKLTLQKAIDICRASHVSAAGDRSGVRQLIGDIHVDQLATRRTPRVELMLTHPSGSAAVSCVPDTGAEATVMGAEMAASLSIPLQTTPSSGSAVKFSSAGNTPLTCIGQFGATVTLDDSEIYTTVYVLQEVTGLLLGWCDAVRLRILPADFPAQIPAATWRRQSVPDPARASHDRGSHDVIRSHEAAIRRHFRVVFDGNDELREMTGGPMVIELTEDAVPTALTAARTIPYCWREQIKSQLDELVAKGIAAPVDYPTEWCHPMRAGRRAARAGSVERDELECGCGAR